MASRLIDTLITYRVVKLLVTPFERQEAFKQGIIDKDGKVLKKNRDLTTSKEKKAYTYLHRFVFNLKRILKKVGFGSKLGSFAVALALLLKENKEYEPHKTLIESAVVAYLKETNQYDQLLSEQGEVKSVYENEPVMTCFGIDVYEVDNKLVSEDEYEYITRSI
jgi:hypothetical protein